MRILCIKTDELPAAWTRKTGAYAVPFFEAVPDSRALWIERPEAEEREEYRQIIPYVLIRNARDEFLCYRRHGSEKRLRGLCSCGSGGHVEIRDRAPTLRQTVENGIERELSEELSGYEPGRLRLSYRGVVNEIETPVSRVHLALVYLARCEPGYEPAPGAELAGAFWQSRAEIETPSLEGWSALALRLL